MADYPELQKKAIELGKLSVQMTTAAGSGHPSSSLSIAHLVTALMYREMRYDPHNPWLNSADRLVLSEGHAVPIVYAAYCDLGGVVGSPNQVKQLTTDDALTLREADSLLDGHPNPALGFPFFDSATGSLGQGVSAAAGLALAAKADDIDRRFFVLVGDGEAREGQVWEAMDAVAENNLTNVVVIFNANGQGQSDNVSDQQSAETLAAKAEAFGFETRTIDGHDYEQIFNAVGNVGDKPVAVIAKTVKGWGVNEFLGSNYHGKPLKDAQVEQALADLDAKAAELGVADADASAAADLKAPESAPLPPRPAVSAGDFAAAADAAGMGDAVEAGELSTRRAYGAALLALGVNPHIVATDGDVKNSTFAEPFAKAYPDRYFEARIAEQNMITMAVGLAAGGKVPFASSFAKFLVRGYDQVEMAAITNANIKLVGSHAGISLAADGPSQMGVTDVTYFRSLAHAKRVDGAPACRVMLPSDAVSAFKLTELMANIDGMCYMRTHRPDVPILYNPDEPFTEGGFKHLVDGSDLCIVTSGYMVHVVREAMALMAENGLEPSLVDVYALPLADPDAIIQIGDDCNGQILVIEDNYIGGVADEIAVAAAGSDLGVTVSTMTLDAIPKSAKTPESVLEMTGLSAKTIAAKAQSIFDAVQ